MPSKVVASDEVDRTLFSSPIVTLGQFRCSTAHPRFIDSGPAPGCMFVFPRTAVWIQHDGHAPFVADPNVVTFYNPGQRYTRRRLSPDGDHADWYVVSDAVMLDAAARFDPSAVDRPERPLPFSHGPSTTRAYLAQRCLFEYVGRESHPDPLLVEEAVLTALGRALTEAFEAGRVQSRDGARRRRGMVEEARAVLALRYASRLSLRELAGQLEVSPFHLARSFHGLVGLTLHEYQTRLRLRAALGRLRDPRVDLTALAMETGFSSHSHFTSTFRRRFGLTPSALRRALAAEKGSGRISETAIRSDRSF